MATRTLHKQLEPGLNGLMESLGDLQMRDAKMRKEIEAILRPMVRTVKSLVPKPGYPGDKPEFKPLRDTIAVRARTVRTNAVWYGMVGPSYPAGAHGHLVEFGTQPHAVNSYFRVGQDEFMYIGDHPGARATPFIEPAMKKHRRQILRDVGKLLNGEMLAHFKNRMRGRG